MIGSLYRLVKGLHNYSNPLSLLRQRLQKKSHVTVVDRATGLRFTCRLGADRMMAETFHSKVYDVPLVPLRAGDTVLDIGANHGFYACWAGHQGANVHAFEPDPRTFELLVHNIRQNGLENRVHAYPQAVGAATGTVELHCTSQLGGGMSTIVPDFVRNTHLNVDQRVTVEVLSWADALLRCNADRLRICKLDCEGAELAILATLGVAAREKVDAFAMEYHGEAYELSRLMQLLLQWPGFHLSKVPVGEAANANLMLVRSEAILQWFGMS